MNNKLTHRNTLEISFESLKESHFSSIHTWFNAPHIQTFYSLRSWTMEEVRQKLTSYIHGVGQIKSYIIFIDKIPVGYIQQYPVKEHPWDNLDLSDEMIQESVGIDLFIGEKEFLGKGFGCLIVDNFLKKHVWPYYRYCLADPDIRNAVSIRLFKKCGFKEHKQINSKDALKHPVTLQLLIKQKE
jgi:aminoglycoside 6'-N-acetyltransferase